MFRLILRPVVALVLGLVLLSPPAAAQPPEILPLDQVKPGMTGYGLTVFRGFTVERFKVTVIDVLRNFLPKQDLILVYIDHPVLKKTGVVGGMSGSPIYFGGKLAGALAYGWRFSKEPVAGITPIQNMLELLKRPRRGPAATPYMARGEPPSPAGRRALARLRGRRGWWLPGLGPVAPPAAQEELAPVAVPMTVAGLDLQGMNVLKDGLAEFGFEPVQGGGRGVAEGPEKYEAGGALGVELASGDVAVSTTGTVTWVDDGKVLGFGHRMFNAGEIYLPAVTAKVVHTLASVARSFKIASPARVVGSLVQDRQAGVLVDTGTTVRTVPLRLTVRTGKQTRTFDVRLARHRILTPTLLKTVVMNALSEGLSDVSHATFTARTRIAVSGHEPVRVVEHHYAESGVGVQLALGSRGIKAVGQVLDNPFGPAQIERIDVDVDVTFAKDVLEIRSAHVAGAVVEPGSRVTVQVVLARFGGAEETRSYAVRIPADLDGSVVLLDVAGGGLVRQDVAPPRNLGQLLRSLEQGYPARAVVVGLEAPTQGVKLQGHVIGDLPASVADALQPGTRAGEETVFSPVRRSVHPTRELVNGRQVLRLRVVRENK